MTPKKEAPFLRATVIEVKGLFGIYNHRVVLNADERITIIHGPNGVGKTVFLGLTTAVLTNRMTRYLEVPFSTLSVSFDDGSVLSLKKETELKDRRQAQGSTSNKMVYRWKNKKQEESFEDSPHSAEEMALRVAKEIPFVFRVGADQWMDDRAEMVLTTEELLAQYIDVVGPRYSKSRKKVPPWLSDLRRRMNVHFIETQRLLQLSRNLRLRRSSMPHSIPTVREYAEDLKNRISETLTDYGKRSEKLDQTFPQRLLKTATEKFDIEELKRKISEINTKRSNLRDIGLLSESSEDPTAEPDDQLDETQRKVMTLYVQDTFEKLSVFDDLAKRIETLCTIVNGKFENKKIRILREAGLQAVGLRGQPLPLEALSSGEQHEIVLLYNLLFKVKPNTLVLIDEPELSLHVSWQKNFLDDLSKIVALSEFDVVLATHSPYIVGDHSDLMIPLSAEVQP